MFRRLPSTTARSTPVSVDISARRHFRLVYGALRYATPPSYDYADTRKIFSTEGMPPSHYLRHADAL